MRRALILFLLLAPLAAATSPGDPYSFTATFDPAPIVGVTSRMTLRIDARADLDAALRLGAPGSVLVQEPRERRIVVTAGESVEEMWVVLPTSDAFWKASLWVNASAAQAWSVPAELGTAWQPVGGCCSFVHSTRDGSRWGTPDEAIAGLTGNVTYTVDVTAKRAVLTMEVRSLQEGVTASGAASAMGEPLAPMGRDRHSPQDLQFLFELANATQITAITSGKLVFEGDPLAAEHGFPIDCVNLEIVREGDGARIARQSSCEASSDRPRGVPGPSAFLVAILALAARSAYSRVLA